MVPRAEPFVVVGLHPPQPLTGQHVMLGGISFLILTMYMCGDNGVSFYYLFISQYFPLVLLVFLL